MTALALEHRGIVPLTRSAKLLGLPRARLYRAIQTDHDQPLRDMLHAIALDWPQYGYRTMTRELCRRGLLVNEKRVRRVMREEHLILAARGRRGLPYRKHGFAAFSNLASDFKATAINQLWVADFTYVRLFGAFVFVAVILDAFSRKVVGWSIARHYQASLIIDALRMALRRRRPGLGFIHHSDRGGTYFDDEYLSLLRKNGATISMSRAGKPSDNAICERFMRTFKYEEVLIRDFADLVDAYRSFARYLDVTYNERRLHSALGYRPPAEFERMQFEAPLTLTPA